MQFSPGSSGNESGQPDDEQDFSFKRHIAVSWYGDFELTDAIRPCPQKGITPKEGYRYDIYQENGAPNLLQITAAATREKLYDLFIELSGQMGEIVDVDVNIYHRSSSCGYVYLRDVDSVVLRSKLWDFQDLLLNDGNIGISLISMDGKSTELLFDDHKLLKIWGEDLNRFESILRRFNLSHDPSLQFIMDGEHDHLTCDNYREELSELIEQIEGDSGEDPFSCV